MKLYNTLTRTVDDITPLNPPTVTVYTCGPTVYDYAHIGHWFNYVRMDMLIRTLRASGLKPKWVMNITDVGHLVSDADEGEDKLEKGARREGKTAWEVAKFYTDDFLRGMKQLKILEPDHIVRATDHIDEQIDLIKQLETKGYTYVIDDGVYYDTTKFEGYSAFARLDLDEQAAGARVAVNTKKHNQTDFALWKFSPKEQKRDMEWDSPWGKGFPGWHIECSAMSMKYLGDTLDIHTGGIDHIPIHHTNEIAQSEAATGKRFAEVWMHSNHVMVNGEKVSKSLGNGIRLDELAAKGYTPDVIRLNVLESHYRTQSKFSWDGLEAAKARFAYMRSNISWVYQSRVVAGEASEEFAAMLTGYRQRIVEALAHDLATPKAISIVHAATEAIAAFPASRLDIPAIEGFDDFFYETLGLRILDRSTLSEPQQALITQREAARASSDWQASDTLRDTLIEQGIGVRDTPQGTIWYRL